jgi:L-amino acid N-acyltransferase YncA
MRVLELVPLGLDEANAFVNKHHRHYAGRVGHKFSIGVAEDGTVRGVIIAGRPNARGADDGYTLEVLRCCTDGVKNGCSMLYGAAWRAARALGYRRLITYISVNETGASVYAANFRCVGEVRGRSWNCEARPRVDVNPKQDKLRFELAV